MADFELVTACGHLKGSVNELCGLIDGTEHSFWADEQKPTLSDKAMLVVSKKLGVVEEYFFLRCDGRLLKLKSCGMR